MPITLVTSVASVNFLTICFCKLSGQRLRHVVLTSKFPLYCPWIIGRKTATLTGPRRRQGTEAPSTDHQSYCSGATTLECRMGASDATHRRKNRMASPVVSGGDLNHSRCNASMAECLCCVSGRLFKQDGAAASASTSFASRSSQGRSGD